MMMDLIINVSFVLSCTERVDPYCNFVDTYLCVETTPLSTPKKEKKPQNKNEYFVYSDLELLQNYREKCACIFAFCEPFDQNTGESSTFNQSYSSAS